MADIDHNKAVRQITDTLKGPVASVFRKIVPAFAEIKAEDFYDSVMANSELLHGCLLIFRKRRDAFSHLLVDSDGRVVNDDFVRLRCGRTVHDIIAMVVRTHAKRHFRASLGGDPNDPRSASGKLYQAMNEYLIHEWQVPLTEQYAKLPAHAIAEMGPALLDLKTPQALAAVITAVGSVAAQAPQVAAAKVSTVVPGATPARTVANDSAPPAKAVAPVEVESHSREADFWWETLNDPQVRSALGPMSEADQRELTALFCQIGDHTRSNLLAPMGFSLFQAAVLMTVSYRSMGRAGFSQVFGKPGQPQTVSSLATRLGGRGVSSRTDLRTLQKTTEAVVSSLPRQGGQAARPPRVAS